MAKQWQKWLDVCHRPRLEQKTAELMNDKKRRALNTFSPVKTNTSLKCTLKIPGIFEQLSDHKIATGPQRQPHRIAKNERPLARFSPRRDVCGWEQIYIYIQLGCHRVTGSHEDWVIFSASYNRSKCTSKHSTPWNDEKKIDQPCLTPNQHQPNKIGICIMSTLD